VLVPAALPNLDVLAGFMKATPASLEIVGYADDAERTPAALAQARADAVRRYMMACGVSGRYLTTRTERTNRAACRTHSASCSARDGRAELRFVEPPPPAPSPATDAPPPPPTPDGQ
jgi:outer membrane protein OmpA-like peptidoglycan-associated protein